MSLKLYSEPIEGLEMLEPERYPAEGEVLLGYEIVNEKGEGTFTKPKPKKMNIGGWITFGTLLLLFWPTSCLPCFLSNSYDIGQRPVYGIDHDK